MTEEVQVAPEAATDVTYPEVEGPEKDQPAKEAEVEAPAETEAPEEEAKKSAAKERRERDKAYKVRLREETEAALSKAAVAEAKLAKIKGAASSEPKEAEFSDYTEYAAAKAVWRYAQSESERDAGEVSAEVEQARKDANEYRARERALAFQGYDAAREEARTRIADFDAVVGQPGLFPLNSHLPDLIVQSENSADVAYEIAKDRNLHDMLLKAHPIEAARIIGRIEAQVSAPPPRSKSSAPDPIKPVRSTSSSSAKSPNDMSPSEYRAWRENGGTF